MPQKEDWKWYIDKKVDKLKDLHKKEVVKKHLRKIKKRGSLDKMKLT